MRKHVLIAGMLIVAALAFAMPSKADTVDFTLTGGALGGSITFSLPETFTPTAGTGSGPFQPASAISAGSAASWRNPTPCRNSVMCVM